MRSDLTKALVKTIHASIDCPEDCSDCCRVGWEAGINHTTGDMTDFNMTSPEKNSICKSLDQQTGKCTCYEDRPFWCSLYFKVEGHPACNRGLRPDVPIPLLEAQEMVKTYLWLEKEALGQ